MTIQAQAKIAIDTSLMAGQPDLQATNKLSGIFADNSLFTGLWVLRGVLDGNKTLIDHLAEPEQEGLLNLTNAAQEVLWSAYRAVEADMNAGKAPMNTNVRKVMEATALEFGFEVLPEGFDPALTFFFLTLTICVNSFFYGHDAVEAVTTRRAA